MKNNQHLKSNQFSIKNNQRNPTFNQDYSKISESKLSDSAFEVVDYGYEPQQKSKLHNSNKKQQQ